MNAGVTGDPESRDRRGRPRRLTLVALSLAGVIAATLLVALGAEAVVSRASCTDHPVVVNLAAADEVAPAIEHVSRYFNAQRNNVNGHCAVVHVVSEQPSDRGRGGVRAEVTVRPRRVRRLDPGLLALG